MSASRLSALVVVRNEEDQLADCLERLAFADEIVVVLDRCNDRSAEIAARFTDRLLAGDWPNEGARRNAGIEACSGDWIFEVDADERVSEALAAEIRTAIGAAAPGYFLVPFNNYVGGRLVRDGWGASWGMNSSPRLFSKGAKRWGHQQVHPAIELEGARRRLNERLDHYLARDVSDLIARLDRYTAARAKDLRAGGDIGSLAGNVRRLFSRFFKCYVMRKGYREGALGFLNALFAGLYPLLSHLRARLEDE